MKLTKKARNQLEMVKTPIAAEVPASIPDLRAWIAVYPPRVDRDLGEFVVRRFEVPKQLLENEVDIHQEDLINLEVVRVADISKVEAILVEWSFDPALLSAPWNCDYPL